MKQSRGGRVRAAGLIIRSLAKTIPGEGTTLWVGGDA
jgi:hypothetical protein